MNFLYQYLPENLIYALGKMIFHSFWQGAVLAFALGIFLLITNSRKSQLRYNFSVAALILFVAACATTFFLEFDSQKPQSIASNISSENIFAATNVFENPIQLEKTETTLWNYASNYFNQNISLFVFGWMLGLLFFSLRFTGSVLYVQKLRTRGLLELDIEWVYRSREIGKKAGIKKFIPVFESLKTKVPVTIGLIKPIILLPVGMIGGLPYTQIEALIAHEFAHIKRYDFVVNLFQTFAETIFFYHPAVWWISNQVREERENCCDDITVTISGNQLAYSKALYNLLTIQNAQPELALAASGKVNHLLRRIKRMNGEKSKLSYGGKFAAFMLVFASLAAVLAFTNEPVTKSNKDIIKASVFDFSSKTENNVLETITVKADTTSIKKGKQTFTFTEKVNGETKKYKAKLNNGKLEELFVDGEKVDKKDFSEYEEKISKRVDKYATGMKEFNEQMKKYREEMKQQKEKLAELKKDLGSLKKQHDFDFDFDFNFPDHVEIPDIDSAKIHKILSEVPRNLHKHFKNHSLKVPHVSAPPIPPVHIHKDDCDFEFDEEKFSASMENWGREFEKGMKKFGEAMAEFDSKKIAETVNNALNSREFKEGMKNLKSNLGKVKVELEKLKSYLADVKEELVNDKLVSDEADLDKFYLSKSEMKVNGKVVTPELHKKYLELYKKHYGKELKDEQKINF